MPPSLHDVANEAWIENARLFGLGSHSADSAMPVNYRPLTRPCQITLHIPGKELKARLKSWKQPKPRHTRGALAKYAKLTTSASEGAVTDEGL